MVEVEVGGLLVHLAEEGEALAGQMLQELVVGGQLTVGVTVGAMVGVKVGQD